MELLIKQTKLKISAMNLNNLVYCKGCGGKGGKGGTKR